MDILVNVCGTVADIFIYIFFCEAVYGRKSYCINRFLAYGIVAAANFAWAAVSDRIMNMYVYFAGGFILMFALSFLYHVRGSRRIFASAVITVLGSASEFAVYGIQMLMHIDMSSENCYIFGIIFSKLISMILIVIVRMIIRRRDVHGNRKYNYIILTCQILSSLIIGLMLFCVQDEDMKHGYILGIIGFILIFMNICVYCMTDYIAVIDELREHEIRLNENLVKTEEQYVHISSNYRQVRSLIHDSNKHLVTIRRYITEGRNGEAVDYIDKIKGKSDSGFACVNSGNIAIDAFVNDLKSRCEKGGVKCTTDIAVNGNDVNIDSEDMAVILGNLFDNAFNAASSPLVSEKNIDIRILISEGKLLIHVENSYNPQNDSERSYGIDNMEKTAEKYGGIYSFVKGEKVYTADVMLPV